MILPASEPSICHASHDLSDRNLSALAARIGANDAFTESLRICRAIAALGRNTKRIAVQIAPS